MFMERESIYQESDVVLCFIYKIVLTGGPRERRFIGTPRKLSHDRGYHIIGLARIVEI